MSLRNRLLRSEEEIKITESEMLSVLNATAGEYDTLITALNSASHMHVGMQLLLKDKVLAVKAKYLRYHSTFSRYISTPDAPEHLSSPVPLLFHLTDEEIKPLKWMTMMKTPRMKIKFYTCVHSFFHSFNLFPQHIQLIYQK